MAEITTSQIGNGTTAYGSDIVVKDLDLDVSNRVKDDTPVLNMAMSKKRKVNSTLPLWTDDIYRLPAVQAQVEGATVATSQAENNGRYNLGNYTQIFSTVIAASGTARAVPEVQSDDRSGCQGERCESGVFHSAGSCLGQGVDGNRKAEGWRPFLCSALSPYGRGPYDLARTRSQDLRPWRLIERCKGDGLC